MSSNLYKKTNSSRDCRYKYNERICIPVNNNLMINLVFFRIDNKNRLTKSHIEN